MAAVPAFESPFRHRTLDAMLEWLEERGIEDRCVLAAMSVVPRQPFIALQAETYDVAVRLQALQLVGDEHVLQVGIGSGYTTAVLSLLSAHVYAIDPDPEVSSAARDRLVALDLKGASIACHAEDDGWPERAPYDAILVMGSRDELPPSLVEQLAVGGRLVMAHRGWLVRATKRSATELVVEQLGPQPPGEGN